jgi:hypothetical protein
MDKVLERKNKDKILRRLGNRLQDLGFRRTKPTFFTRPRGLVVEFVHLHKYTFAPEFRVHLGLRVANDSFEAAALNGPDSQPYVCKDSPSGRRFNFCFHDAPDTVESCAAEIDAYVRAVAEPWFRSWQDTERLLADDSSPLAADAKAHLRSAIQSGPDPERIEVTRRLLGAA